MFNKLFVLSSAMLFWGQGFAAVSAPQLTVPVTDDVSSAKIPITPETILSTGVALSARIAGDLRWIPETNSVLVPVNEGAEEGVWTERIDVNTGHRQRLVKETGVHPSPDGRTIAYISGQSGSRQIWVASLDGSGAKQVTEISGGIASQCFSWSPDSSHIAFIAPPSVPVPTRGTSSEVKVMSSVVVDDPRNAEQTERDNPEICVLDIRTGALKKIAICPYRPSLDPVWSLDGKTIFSDEYNYDGHHIETIAISVETGERRNLIEEGVADTIYCMPAPNGRDIAFTYSNYHGGYWHDWQIALAPLRGNSFRRIPTPFRAVLLGWSGDGSHMYVQRRNGVNDQFLSLDAVGKVGKDAILMDGTYAVGTTPAVSTDGRFAWIDADWQGRFLLQTASMKDPKPRTVVNFTPEIDQFSLGETEDVHWMSRDGVANSGILVKPVGYIPGKRYPLIVSLHGGPGGGVDTFGLFCISALESHMWANKGYAVLVPEYRSSGMYGFDKIVQERKTRKCFDGDFDDIMSGVDYLIATGIADPARMAVAGHSYGGVETDWIITHTHRFRAAVSYEGYSDLYSLWGTNKIAVSNLEWLFNGTPLTESQAYLYNSAMYDAGNATTPTLFINAENGINSPSTSSMYTAMKKHGVDTQYLEYKGEGHVVSQPANQRNLIYWCVNWVDTHLGGAPTPDPKGIFDISAMMPVPGRITKR